MIKLLASDIDGTLLFDRLDSVAPVIFDEIARLKQKGIRFCPTSGRRLESMRRLFAPIADELYYICENGGSIFAPDGTLLDAVPIDHETAMWLAHAILALDGCEVMVSGVRGCYLFPKGGEVVRAVEAVGNHIVYVPTPEDIPEEIVKISIFCQNSAEVAPKLTGWPLPPQIAGAWWVDFTRADKATGLRRLGELLNISREEILAIGDNYNDVGMLQYAGTPYLMASAVPELRARFPQQCRRVEDVLKSL